MDKRIEKARILLKDRGKTSAIEHLNNISDDKAIEQLSKAIDIYGKEEKLNPKDLQKLIKRFKEFSIQAEKNQNKVEEKLLITLEEVLEYNRTGINPYSKKEKASRLEVDKQKLVYEDDSLLSLLLDLNSKCPELDIFIGGLNKWPHSCTKQDWQERIDKLVFLKELYPVRENISEILKGGISEKHGKKEYEFDINKTEVWFHELWKNKEYQRSGGKPHITNITQEIIKRHGKDEDSDGKPTKGAIKYQRRKLNLMQYNFRE